MLDFTLLFLLLESLVEVVDLSLSVINSLSQILGLGTFLLHVVSGHHDGFFDLLTFSIFELDVSSLLVNCWSLFGNLRLTGSLRLLLISFCLVLSWLFWLGISRLLLLFAFFLFLLLV